MSVVFKKNGSDISNSIDGDSVRLMQTLTKEVSRLSFFIKNYSGKATIALGDQIDIYEDSVHTFGGTCVTSEKVVRGGILIATKYTVLDWSFKLNSKLVVKNYAATDPGNIVIDILSSFTDGTFTHANVQLLGSTLSTVHFNYEQVTASIEKLASMIGWEWYVDADKDVHFFPPTLAIPAPFTIDDTSGNLEWPTLDVDQNLQNMKNSVFVIGGNYSVTFTAVTTHDNYLTDGTASVYPLAYPYDISTLVVTLNGVSQTIGTDQVTDPATVQVLYNDTGRFIRFTTTPTTGKAVVAYGNAQIPIIAQGSSQPAIALYGERQDVIIDRRIASIAEAQTRADAQISEFSAPVYTVRFSTVKTGLIVGQTLTVTSTLFGVNIQVVVKRIEGIMYSPTQFRYTVEAVGTDRVSMIDFLKVLLLQANADNMADTSSVLQVLLSFPESITAADTASAPTSTSPPYLWGTMTWGFGAYHA